MQILSNQFYKTLEEQFIIFKELARSEKDFLIELWYVCDTKKEFISIADKFMQKEGYR